MNKRPLDDTDDTPSNGTSISVPSYKRTTSTDTSSSSMANLDPRDMEEDEDQRTTFHLVSQNNALALESIKNKHEIIEARKELEITQRKSREMEAHVSLIQRAWAQLDTDTKLLLDSLSPPDAPAESAESSTVDLLTRLIHAGVECFSSKDPTSTASFIPALDADQWSTLREIEEATAKAIKRLQKKSSDNTGEQMDVDVDESEEDADPPSEAIENLLPTKAAFTVSLFKRLCNTINNIKVSGEGAALLTSNPTYTHALTAAREAESQRLLLRDQVTKLSIEIIQLNAKVRTVENDKIRAEKSLYKSLMKGSEGSKEGGEAVSSPKGSSSSGVGLPAATSTITSPRNSTGHNGSSGGDNNSSSSSGGTSGDSYTGDVENDKEKEKELRRQIALLERQLEDSEAAKAKAESNLTDRLSKLGAINPDPQIAEVRQAMTDERQRSQDRESTLFADLRSKQDRAISLQAQLEQMERMSAFRMDEVVTITNGKLKKVREDAEEMEKRLSACEADAAVMVQMKNSFEELEAVEAGHQREQAALTLQVQKLKQSQITLEEHLQRARDREMRLQQEIVEELGRIYGAVAALEGKRMGMGSGVGTLSCTPSHESKAIEGLADSADCATLTKYAEGQGESEGKGTLPDPEQSDLNGVERDQETEKDNDEQMDVSQADDMSATDLHVIKQASATLVETSQQRVKDLQSELDNSNASINDLILEIEAVSAEEIKVRGQNTRLLKQITDCQLLQRQCLEDNKKLQNEIEDLKISSVDIESKCKVLEKTLAQTEGGLMHFRGSEHAARADLQALRKESSALEEGRSRDEQRIAESQQKIRDCQHYTDAALHRSEQLQKRCDELSAQCETERKARMEAERQALAKAKATSKKIKQQEQERRESKDKEKDSTESDGSNEMLDMTLNMLRCSVCKDRFKSVAITRCYHLFCKECVDENLRNRHRKCPACGEKFGQDDVKQIFFAD